MGTESSCPSRLTIHATLVSVAGEGLLFLGEAGIGKSTAALHCLAIGGQLVADDVVVIGRIGDQLLGFAPRSLQGMLSIPELGIFDVRDVLGPRYFSRSSVITRCVELIGEDEGDQCSFAKEFCGLKLPTSFQKNDKQRTPPELLNEFDIRSLRQSEARFLQSHDTIVASGTFR